VSSDRNTGITQFRNSRISKLLKLPKIWNLGTKNTEIFEHKKCLEIANITVHIERKAVKLTETKQETQN